ncbi:ADP-dependent (S)-NAD(P)H-hydrate dehydratase [Streptococcus constellatus]|uniref:ADP-dependent (S)-NAD(P)H-hydrate dehydratase n=1 Tax=Streptococcus constellatus TaxID=76860 RepID=A0A564TGT6_STRCV|nr:NAD(P)H-hydrate dehydratase [Streptococcus constellatus]VUX01323.1 ADP-dependent (S)-NAD(P)H-hydrate dehydratase [Streptococcus gordonii]VUX05731.1 ADP-dependent (S)-NAD(P)H-hydrate dehydratase [Streptococcus constellatus]
MKVVDRTVLEKVIQPRSLNSHKGDYGRLLLIGGTYPFGGAIIMAALAAVHSGAGLVTVATDRENIAALHAHLPEAMAFDIQDEKLLKEQIQKAEVLLIGPGLAENSLEKEVLQLIVDLVSEHQILIMDGGAISLYSKGTLPFPKAQTIFTPHQKEWERLSGLKIADQTVEKSQEAVNSLPAGTIVVQKKHGTTIFQSGNGNHFQLSIGGPYQATGGMGDTLAGMIAGFAGQFKMTPLLERVTAAVYLHSAIAEELSKENYVVLPTEISKEIPKWMKKLAKKENML